MRYLSLLLVTGALLSQSTEPNKQPSQIGQYLSALRVIREKCVRCHSGEMPPQGLDLTSVDKMMKGGKHGPALVRYKPYDSLIWKVITAQDGFPVMPPSNRLDEIEVEAIRIWIYHGAMQSSMSGQEP